MFSDPVKIVEKSNIQPGMEVADLGVGSGAYTVAISRALAGTGRVYSVDVQKELLSKIKNQATKEGLYNVEVIWGDVEKLNGTQLREVSIDVAFICNVLFQLHDKSNIVKEIKRILKPAGRVVVVDWQDSFGGLGPVPKAVFRKEKAKEMFEKEGFHLDREIEAGAHHYGLIYKKL